MGDGIESVSFITPNVKVVPSLLDTSDYSRFIFDNLPVGVILLQLQGKVVFANKYAYEKLGINKNQLYKSLLEKNYSKPTLTHISKHLQLPISTDTIHDERAQLYQLQNLVLPNHMYLVVISDVNQIASDVRKQKLFHRLDDYIATYEIQAREKAEQALEMLKIAESRLSKVINSNMIGIHFWDITGQIKEANSAFLKMLGYTRKDLEMGKLNWKKLTPPAYYDITMKGLKKIDKFGTSIQYEKEYFRKDGTKIPIIVGATYIDKNKTEGVSFVLDISELKQLEKQREAFIGFASHELKNPLTSILAYIQLMHRQPLDKKSKDYIKKINAKINILIGLTNDFMDIAKIKIGRLELQKETFDLMTITKEKINEIKLINKKVLITVKGRKKQEIFADKVRIGQVIANLFSNAIKYSPDSQKIIVKVKLQGNEVVVSIKDFGVGLAPHLKDRVFEPFFRAVSNTDKTPAGTGIGLYLCLEIMKSHNGKIWLDSTEGKGSTFYFSLPLH